MTETGSHRGGKAVPGSQGAAGAGEAGRAAEHRAGRAAHGVYVYLRGAILDGSLDPEAPISQVQIAKQLNVSRTPVREALRMLQRDGLIDSVPNRRARISVFEARDLDELYASRIMLECLAVRLTVPQLSEQELAEMAYLCGEIEQIDDAGKPEQAERWERLHLRFHQVLRSHSGPRLTRESLSLFEHSERYRRSYLAQPLGWRTTKRDHALIMEAVTAGDGAQAAEHLGQHMARTALTVLAQMSPNYRSRAIHIALEFVSLAAGAQAAPRR